VLPAHAFLQTARGSPAACAGSTYIGTGAPSLH